jgi:hypothetical protein
MDWRGKRFKLIDGIFFGKENALVFHGTALRLPLGSVQYRRQGAGDKLH